MYWFLVMHADLRAARGDLGIVKGKPHRRRALGRYGAAAPLVQSGIDPARDDVTIAPVAAPKAPS